MKNNQSLLTCFLAAAAIVTLPLIGTAQAGTCEGTVRGLSNNYNPETGSGFLAIRKKKSAKSRKVGELFNGDVVTIYAHEGNWYEVDAGWVYDRYVRARDCDW